ncbi:hypothetical protein VPH35_113800 [Triticum aestivum]|uniref:uncharacterized protein n=1 Tax=Triticum aestivum TaxID=4565 RepID=UPI001D014D33|nr:uncharacterized protein LOC123135147 [Triticum aestivum]
MPAPPRPWADLPSELLAVVSGRLHDPTDFIRFHAVCTSWRESLPKTASLRPDFLPWLVAPPSGRRFSVIRLRCVFSKTSYHAEVPVTLHKLGWVARADGTADWFFSTRDGPRLVDHLTGEAIPLPPFPHADKRKMRDKSRGIVYGDGTVFLYNFSKSDDNHQQGTTSTNLRAAILSPGHTAWTVVERGFRLGRNNIAFENNHCFAAYHNGKILVCVDGDDSNDIWHLLVPTTAGGFHASVIENDEMCAASWRFHGFMALDWRLDTSHVLESHGELLRVSVLVRSPSHRFSNRQSTSSQVLTLAVLVHSLVEEIGVDGRQTVRWARRDGLSFADRVMFLGFPSSFAVDAARFCDREDNIIAGCVYFFLRWSREHGSSMSSPLGVFRYNLINDKTKFMEYLPHKWSSHKNDAGMWLVPQPRIAPVKVIKEWLEAPKAYHPTIGSRSIRKEKRPEQSKESFSFVVQNHPPGVSAWIAP